MKTTMLAGILTAAIALAAPAHADVDTDFTNQLHAYGIYGQKDYNAWLAKITCERLYKGVDVNALGGLEHALGEPGAGHGHGQRGRAGAVLGLDDLVTAELDAVDQAVERIAGETPGEEGEPPQARVPPADSPNTVREKAHSYV